MNLRFSSGALSSLASSLYGGSGFKNAEGNFVQQTRGLNGIIGGGDFGTLAFGTVMGGAGAKFSGGNFWQGAATGLTVSLLNHVMHSGDGEIDPPKKGKVALINEAPNENFKGFFGKLDYFFSGGVKNGFQYDIDGNSVGFAPLMGSPDIIGGPLKGGVKAIKIGRYLLNPKAWHTEKNAFLALVGESKFINVVGKNPDISFKGTQIILTGSKSSPFYGKSFQTNYSVKEFINWIK